MHAHPTPGIDRSAKYVALTTYRDTGATVTTPVWFVDGPHVLRVITGATSGKVRRIRSDGRVVVAECDVRGRLTGPPIPGRAVLVGDADTARVVTAIDQKYGWQSTAAQRVESLRAPRGRSGAEGRARHHVGRGHGCRRGVGQRDMVALTRLRRSRGGRVRGGRQVGACLRVGSLHVCRRGPVRSVGADEARDDDGDVEGAGGGFEGQQRPRPR